MSSEAVRLRKSREPKLDPSPKIVAGKLKLRLATCAHIGAASKSYPHGQIRHIQGDRDYLVNKGVLCGKGASGAM